MSLNTPQATPQDAKPAALVTGASGGIGEELAHVFAADGHNLVLVARSADKLASVASVLRDKHQVRAETVALDLGDRASFDALDAALASHGLYVETLVNNAGYGDKGPFAESDAAYQLGMVDLNVYALTALARRFAPDMVARRRGGILNVASTAAFLPGPNMAVYYATKAYVLSLSDALAYELKGTGVTVTAVCPGPTASGFQAAANMEGARLIEMSPMMSSRKVAEIGYRGFKKRKPVVITGAMNKIQSRAMPFTPRAIKLGVVNWLQS